eukprot:CAMPEP_0198247920 /NCGR_PEP_ID=MMETSP1446-20131203/46722_1 /TAXON_ID=1461542 ORGANISM="Unidentified sp, Strain CCMP2111" /NCGR_SAMPLE_ID=MMETSP1446 /ASSEMBLY_ACC=CAM_ASM_001112 /LENGTH=861 /DNA_ID=CAMNT_0043932249 /DNA_START=77 /DNA_END=2662 /DNA_ORIENTATION=-
MAAKGSGKAVAIVAGLLVLLAINAAAGAHAEETTIDPPGDESVDGGLAHEQKFTFQAEVSRLLDIIINSLYSNRDIFLRELISNASDALDKIRLLALTKPDALGDQKDLEVRISFDPEEKVLSIRDTGIGMTRDDLVNNLGTIAKSGTSAFLDNLSSEGADMNLIGQFGVGFYSAFLAADKVQVVSKHNDDPKQHVWESSADGDFVVSEDADAGRSLGRGTQINLFLKEEALEYVDQHVLSGLIAKYSEFINYPILLREQESKEIEVDAPEEVEGHDDAEDDEDLDGVDDTEDDTPAAKVKKTVTEWVWKVQNDAKAIWLRNPSEVTPEEYSNFFEAVSRGAVPPAGAQGGDNHLAHTHFKAEGDVEFRAVLFIPREPPFGLSEDFSQAISRIKLYVRRVLISDTFDDLLPRFLSFVIGVVDSDTLPLNVSRESLQHHASLKTIKKKLVRKVLDMLKKLADAKQPEQEEHEEGQEPDASSPDVDEKQGDYESFWKTFGKFLKMGIVEDQTNRLRISKLLRFKSSHPDFNRSDDDRVTGFEDYVGRMKPGQSKIYYLIGSSVEELKQSPFAEKLVSEGFEVIYFTEALDEYVMQHLVEFDDLKMQNAAREDLSLDTSDPTSAEGDDEAEKERKATEKRRQKQLRSHFRPFTKWWKGLLPSDQVDSVKVSNRLTTSPCVVVSSKYGYTANMEKIVKAQAMGDASVGAIYFGKKVLEINPFHPSIKKLKTLFEQHHSGDDGDDGDTSAGDEAKAMAIVMYETSLLESGFEPADSRKYARKVYDMVNLRLGVDPNISAEDIVDDFEVSPEDPQEDQDDYYDGSGSAGEIPENIAELIKQSQEAAARDNTNDSSGDASGDGDKEEL